MYISNKIFCKTNIKMSKNHYVLKIRLPQDCLEDNLKLLHSQF